jgi:glucose-1-phosphate cytidylyltransferase
MKAVILAGGLGTRLSEETHLRPKPMVEIGGKPILWHIMKIFEFHGITDFIICCGYKGFFIKDYFNSYHLRNSDITFNMADKSSKLLMPPKENWSVTCVDTGDQTSTGGRLKLIKDFLDPDEPFLMTYGDGVSNVNISELINFHHAHGKLASMTVVNPPIKYGIVTMNSDNEVTQFNEKPKKSNTWINGGFFALDSSVLDYIPGDVMWEQEPLQALTNANELAAFRHGNFWQSMDTISEKKYLEDLLASNTAPWKMWD